MIASLILLALLVAVGLPLWLHDRKHRQDDDREPVVIPDDTCSDDCCTTHEVCPSQTLLQGIGEPAVYYDDEALDRFAGREADGYTEAEVEEFRDILYTLIPSDRLGWCKSLKKRGIVMPAPIHDEFLMLANE